MFKKSLNLLKKQSGQTIIEIVAVIAIGSILIIALVALSVRANRGSEFSKVESQAAKLAAEGVEILRNIKAANGTGVRYDLNCSGVFNTVYTWRDFFELDDGGGVRDNCTANDTYGKIGKLGRNSVECDSSTEAWCLTVGDGTAEQVALSGGRTFQRYVFVADTSTTESGKSVCNTAASLDWKKIKQFTVVVRWTDSSGDHEVTNITCIQKS